jgi:hypothetical protein
LAEFLSALAEEAAGFTLFGVMEAEWRQARAAVARRRSDSRAAAALDIMAASPHCLGKNIGKHARHGGQ